MALRPADSEIERKIFRPDRLTTSVVENQASDDYEQILRILLANRDQKPCGNE